MTARISVALARDLHAARLLERVLNEFDTAYETGLDEGRKAEFVAACLDGRAEGLSPQVFREVCTHIQQSHRIHAVKLIRAVTSCSLADAKARMDRIEANLTTEATT